MVSLKEKKELLAELKKRPIFSSGSWGAVLAGSGEWTATLSSTGFKYNKQHQPTLEIPYERINSVVCKSGVIWSDIQISLVEKVIQLGGIGNADAQRLTNELKQKIEDALYSSIMLHQDIITSLMGSLRQLLDAPFYLANSDVINWIGSHESEVTAISSKIIATAKHPLFSASRFKGELKTQIETLMNILSSRSNIISERNEMFIKRELTAFQAFFKQVETTPLTEEQIRACIVMEDSNLLIAAAGSGKTSVVVGKVGYAILRGYVEPEQILILAYNKHAAEELELRINERLKGILKGKEIKVKTFHALGLEIIADVENVKPTVPDYISGVSGKVMFADLIDKLLASDTTFLINWTIFKAAFWRSAENPTLFSNVESWNQYVKDTGDYVNGKSGYQTLNGELVKSQGELAIANWLYMNGINYEYERPYEYKTANRQYRQYHPDFYFPDIDCYLEHYALDAKGNPPKAFGEKYAESMQWKRALHAEKGTDIFETYFSEFVSGTLFDKLTSELTKRGIQLNPRTHEEVLDKLNEMQKLQSNEFLGLLLTFIKHLKSNRISVGDLNKAAQSHTQRARATIFVALIEKILNQYSKKLITDGAVDFEDMIINASQFASDGRFEHGFKLILVDEFQDISRARADLLQGLLKQAPNCKIFAVGDDWQSIYRFAGSDISIFTAFEKNFGPSAINYLTQTFRSNQGIADVAAWFIQQNNAQFQKTVRSIDPKTEQVISICKIKNKHVVKNQLIVCLNEISSQAKEMGKIVSVYILGRYRYQSPEGLSELKIQFGESLSIEFKTIHSSKGLQADYVILIGLQSGKMGFPSQIADDPLLELVMPVPETFSHAEERRLFYVGLTRARHGVYLLSSKHAPSVFMEELEESPKIASILRYTDADGIGLDGNPLEKCSCGKGTIQRRSGKYGEFLGCSAYPVCNYTRNY